MHPTRKSTRREFLQTAGGAALAASSLHIPAMAAAGAPDLVVVTGQEPKTDPKALVKKAIEALGGMKKFVSRGDKVVVKPNIGWDRVPRQAANTNPDVVAAIIELAMEAGAKTVLVFDNPVANAQASYARSGIRDAAKAAGAVVKYQDERFYKKIALKGTSFLKEWPVYVEAIECDCLINVPIAKHHSMAGVTMALKNHMGIIGGERSQWHRNLDYALAEFATLVKPKLTVLDAYRILVRNGPTGGSVRDTRVLQKCVAGTDQVAVDAYGTRFFQKEPTQLGYLIKAKELGVGETDLAKLNIQDLTI